MTFNFNQIDGPQRIIMRDAFVDAFDAPTLNVLLQDNLGAQPLDTLVAPGPFEKRVFDLILRSRREGWTNDLIENAENITDNFKIRALRDTILKAEAIDLADIERSASTATAGGFERIVRDGGFADWVIWINKMAAIGHQICRVEYTDGVKMGGGTGFLISPDLVLTNYHVVEPQIKNLLSPDGVRCRFDFAVNPLGPSLDKIYSLMPSPEWLVDFSPYSPHDPGDQGRLPDPEHLDYALLRLADKAGEDMVNGLQRGSIQVKPGEVKFEKGKILLIGQHPEGNPLKLSFGVILKVNGNGTRVRYDANTDKGSSGSGVFGERLELVALHHAGDPDYSKLMAEFNQGIPIGKIIDRMQRDGSGVPTFWQ